MSSNWFTTRCPVCGQETLEVYENSKPFENVDTQCLNCGFATYTEIDRLSLIDINDMREDNKQSPLTLEEYDKFSKHYLFIK